MNAVSIYRAALILTASGIMGAIVFACSSEPALATGSSSGTAPTCADTCAKLQALCGAIQNCASECATTSTDAQRTCIAGASSCNSANDCIKAAPATLDAGTTPTPRPDAGGGTVTTGGKFDCVGSSTRSCDSATEYCIVTNKRRGAGAFDVNSACSPRPSNCNPCDPCWYDDAAKSTASNPSKFCGGSGYTVQCTNKSQKVTVDCTN